MLPSHRAFATCPKGLEGLLATELIELGTLDVKQTVAGVGFRASLAVLYVACLRSRLANRVLLTLAGFEARTAATLYEQLLELPWREHLPLDATFAVNFSGGTHDIRNTHFGALKVKDAIVDHFRSHTGKRPRVDTRCPDVRFNVRVHRERAIVSIDLSGDSLHRRGYRIDGGDAPLKENLACAVLLRAGWPEVAARGGPLADPMCGSGTLLIEGARMALGLAAGIDRQRWGFLRWPGHVERFWQAALDQARGEREAAQRGPMPEVFGSDKSARAIDIARQNARSAGLSRCITLVRGDLSDSRHIPFAPSRRGLVVTNPPYGERLGQEWELAPIYRALGERLRESFEGWTAAVMSANPALGKTMGLRSHRQHQLWNGAIAAKLLRFELGPEAIVDASKPARTPVSDGMRMFANRLGKNRRHLAKWLRGGDTNCYRIYDADIPEYAVAVDVYGDWVHVAEYKAPPRVDPEAAKRRLREVMTVIPEALDVPPERVVLKQRVRQRGRSQYQKLGQVGAFYEVIEGEARLQVNLTDYLDTGLFIHHRLARLELGRMARGLRFLNLYCYTAAATVHAALGGASSSTSVDLSTTYLEWARRNFSLNGIDAGRHRLVRSDCRRWLAESSEKFDLIFLDPPTFSNSKGADRELDLQRDHLALVEAAISRLAREGLLIFSTSRNDFELDPSLAARFAVADVTRRTVDRDFRRDKPPHRCWHIRSRPVREHVPNANG